MKQKQKSFVIRISAILAVMIIVSIIGYADKGTESTIPGKGDLVITYDLFNRTGVDSDYVVGYRKNVIFKVENVNPFLYKVTIDGTPYDYFTEVPGAFNLIQGEKSTAKEDDKNKTKNAFKAAGEAASLNKEVVNEKKGAVDAFTDAYNQLSDITVFHNSLRRKILKNKEYETLKSEINNLPDKLGIKHDGDINDIVDRFAQWFEEADREYEKIDFDWLSIYPEFNHLIERLKRYKSNMDKMKNQKVIDTISELLNKFQKENFQRSRIFPTIDADGINITLKIEPINKKDDPFSEAISEAIRVRVKGGWAVNFSTGLLAGINPWEHDYVLQDVEGEQGKVVIVKKNKISVTPNVAALMHVYPRWSGSSGWGGFTFGIGTKDTERISYYLGTGWIFGVKRRFIVNLGFALSKFNILKPEYKLGQVLTKDENLKAENLIKQEFRPSFFIGLSFNLGKLDLSKK